MVKRRRRKSSPPNALSSTGGGVAAMWGGLTGTSSGVNVTPETAMRQAAVYASIRVLSETLAQFPVHICKSAGVRKVYAPEHPLNIVLGKRPNDWQTAFEFFEMMQGHLAARGNCYAQIVAGELGSVTQLIPLRPDRMKVERIENGRLRYIFREESGRETKYNQEQIFHVRGMSSDGVTGHSPISMMSDPIGYAMATDKYGSQFFKNSARPSGILRAEGVIKSDEAQRMKNDWMAAHGGPDNSHRVAVLANGLQWQAIGISSEDAQLLETRQFQVTEIARIFRVPPHMIGDLSHATFSNIEQQSIDFVRYTMLPWVVRWEQAINRDLIADDEMYYAKFCVEGLLRGDSAARSAYYRELINTGVMTINEARELEDLEPVEYGDVNLIQGAMVPLEQLIEQAEAPEPPAEQAQDPSGKESDGEDAPEDMPGDSEEDDMPDNGMTSAIEIGRITAEKNIYQEKARIESERAAAAEQKAADLAAKAAAAEALALSASKSAEESASKYLESSSRQLELAESVAEAMVKLSSAESRCEDVKKENEKIHAIISEQSGKLATAHVEAKKVIKETVHRLLKIETDGIRAAAKRPNMLAALDEFYAKHEPRLMSALAAPCSMYAAIAGRVDVESAVSQHLADSKAMVLDVAGECTAEQIGEAVDLLLCDWDSRSETFTQRLTERA